MRGVLDERSVSLNEGSSGDSDDDGTNEITPLYTSPTRSNGLSTQSTVVRRKQARTEARPDSVRCDCHEPPKPADKASRNRLTIACIVVLLFMIGEVIGSFIIYYTVSGSLYLVYWVGS